MKKKNRKKKRKKTHYGYVSIKKKEKKWFVSTKFSIGILGPINNLAKGMLEYSIASWRFIQDIGQILHITWNSLLPQIMIKIPWCS